MAQAFYGDPVWGWAFPDPARRLEQLRAVWGLALESALGHGWVWVTEGCAAVSLWIPPGMPELRAEDEVRLETLLAELLGPADARVHDTFARFGAARPREPHFYLSLLATHPERAGRGLGMGLLAENLSRTDAAGIATYLESSNPANDHRYERLGFSRFSSFELGEDGPSVTQMWRDAR